MAVFYKISPDAKKVYMVRSSEKKVNDLPISKWEVMETDVFLSKIPERKRQIFINEIEKVKSIAEQKPLCISIISVPALDRDAVRITYHINGKIFREDIGEILKYQEKEKAYDCLRKRGEDFFKKYKYILDKSEDGFYFFLNNELVAEEEYSQVKREHEALTSIQNLKEKIKMSKTTKR